MHSNANVTKVHFLLGLHIERHDDLVISFALDVSAPLICHFVFADQLRFVIGQIDASVHFVHLCTRHCVLIYSHTRIWVQAVYVGLVRFPYSAIPYHAKNRPIPSRTLYRGVRPSLGVLIQ